MAKAAPQMGSRPCRCCSALALLGMSQMRLPPAKHTNCHQHTASASTTKRSSCLTANNLNRSVGPALASYHIRASCRLFFFFFACASFLTANAMENSATSRLPKHVDASRWKVSGWGMHEKMERARSDACDARCAARTEEPPARARELLREIRESPVFWLALRKHLDEADAIFVLEVLQEHSGWKEIKYTKNERLRKEYLRLFDECCFYSRGWRHEEMQQRQRAASSASGAQEARLVPAPGTSSDTS